MLFTQERVASRKFQDKGELLGNDGIMFFSVGDPSSLLLASLELARVSSQLMPAKSLGAGKRDQSHIEATERPS